MREPPSIDSYSAGGFRIAGAWIEGSALILNDRARPWPVASVAALSPGDFDPILAERDAVEFILLGVGLAMAPLPKAVRLVLNEQSMGIEIMDTPAAVRLYNVLASQGRQIACALIAG